MTPEQFKGLQKLIDLEVLPEDIREPINILRNLPAKVFYPNLSKNMKRIEPYVSAIINLDMEEIKTVLKLKYHGALTNNVLSLVLELSSLNDEQLKTFQNIFKNQSINNSLDLFENLRIFFLLKKDKLKMLSDCKNISNVAKYLNGLRPFGFGHINRIIKDFNLEKFLRKKLNWSLLSEKINYFTGNSSNQVSELDNTNDLKNSSEISIQENFFSLTNETQSNEANVTINKNQTTSIIKLFLLIFKNLNTYFKR